MSATPPLRVELPYRRGPWWFGAAGIGNLAHAISDDTARETVNAAWSSGVRGFDTAPHYGLGLSERRLGAALRHRPRNEFLLSTKVGRLLRPLEHVTGDDLAHGFAVPREYERVWDPSPGGVARSLDESRKRMGIDVVDIAYLHDPDEEDPDNSLKQALPALARLRDQGELRAVGVGSKSVEALTAAIRTDLVDIIMVAGRFTLLEQPASALLRECAERGVAVIAAGVFNSGLLSRPEPASRAWYEYGPAPADILRRVHRIREICEQHGVDLPTAAIAFPLLRPEVSAIALGVQSPEQVRENSIRAATKVPDSLWQELGRLPSLEVP